MKRLSNSNSILITLSIILIAIIIFKTTIHMKDNKFSEVSMNYNIYNNKIYGLPIEIIYEGLYINKDLFEKYNIKIPQTYEELKSAIIAFKEQDIIPIAFNCAPEGTYLYQNIAMKLGGKEDIENPFINGKISRCYIESLYYLKELYDLGAFPCNAFTIDDRERNRLFLEKKAAMIVQGSWFIGEGAVNYNDKSVDIIRFPSLPNGKADESAIVYGLGNGNFHLSSKAYEDEAKREIVIKFLKYLTSEEVAKELVYSTGSICDVEDIMKIDDKYLINKGYELVENCSEYVGPPDSFIERTFWESTLVKKIPQVLEGIISPEDVFNELY